MLVEIIVLLFFLAASIYLAYQFRACGQQMEIMQGSNASLSADLDETREENLKLISELHKTRSDLALTRGELEKTRTALNSCTDAINGGS
jgi:septal ring factor EnvC (AmiA/AmiB activator)